MKEQFGGREMGFIFQNSIFDVMNAVENVEIPLLLMGLNPDGRTRQMTLSSGRG